MDRPGSACIQSASLLALARRQMVAQVTQKERKTDPRQAIFAAGQTAPVERSAAPAAGKAPLPDAARILASIGEVAYAWDLETDQLAWGPNAAAVLGIDDPAAIASGRNYARFFAPDTKVTRFDAVMQSGRDDGRGVPYQVEYALR